MVGTRSYVNTKRRGSEMTHVISTQNPTGQNRLHLPPHPKEDRKNKPTRCLEGGKPESVANGPTDYHDALESPCLAQRAG